MGKGTKIIGTLFLILGFVSIAMYFVIGDKYNNFKVVFNSDGGTLVQDQIIKSGEKATKPTDPTKEGSEFLEWRLDGVVYNFDNAVSKDITLKAAWREIKYYTININLEDETYTASVREGQNFTIDMANIPEKEGYVIKFFNENNEEYDINSPVNSDLVLTANYVEIKTYTVKFNSNGGTKVEDIKVVENETISEPVSTKDGFLLDGWYLGEEKFDFTTPISKDITLKAKWSDGPKLNVIFMVDGKVYKTVSVKENTTVSEPTKPSKTGYKFLKWQLDGNDFDFKTKITSETTLTALFEKQTIFKVTFDSNGGSSVKSQEVTGKVTRPTDPTRDGHKFIRWLLNGIEFDFEGTTISEDITLKADWEKLVQYKVTFNNDDGKEITNQVVEKGGKAKRPTDPTKDGFRFVGWIYNHNIFEFDTPITQDIILTASYEIINTNTDDNSSNDSSGENIEGEN